VSDEHAADAGDVTVFTAGIGASVTKTAASAHHHYHSSSVISTLTTSQLDPSLSLNNASALFEASAAEVSKLAHFSNVGANRWENDTSHTRATLPDESRLTVIRESVGYGFGVGLGFGPGGVGRVAELQLS
jgi:hypothetical protein